MANGEAQSGLTLHPLEQFGVHPLFGGHEVHWYTITNQTLWLAIGVLCVFALFVVAANARALVPGRGQNAAELIYSFIHNMVRDVTGEDALPYFPFILTLFLFVFFANTLSLIPMSFAVTSHVAVTGILAITVFLSVTLLGFFKHGTHFLDLFWVRSAPFPMRFVLAPIELISYFVRPVSHSIRLAGNMMAGHAVIEVFAGFATILVISPISIIAITAMYGLEVLVAVVQAYIFTILTCVYLKDAMHPSH
ncbi:MAG: F0F1 ATP synthase subunit A [Rhodobacteraceae bacterium]|nr:F0F1 ATP synthase subunit A [Paracoccaceae bacterium]